MVGLGANSRERELTESGTGVKSIHLGAIVTKTVKLGAISINVELGAI